MNKNDLFNMLNLILEENSSKHDRRLKEGTDNYVEGMFKSFHNTNNADKIKKSNQKRKMSDSALDMSRDNICEVMKFMDTVQVPGMLCKFNIPQVRSRLETLMGSSYVSLTDRDYMQRLQERILEDYEEQMDRRIRVREEEEMERVKNLVLTGKIPLKEAPPEMANHPVMLIENYCNKLIAERRAKLKIYKVKIPTYLYWDDTPDPPSCLSIESGHVFRNQSDRLCHPVETHLEVDDEELLEKGLLLSPEDYEKQKYESSLVKRLMTCETVEEMYKLADDIIGVLKTIDETARLNLPVEDVDSQGSQVSTTSSK